MKYIKHKLVLTLFLLYSTVFFGQTNPENGTIIDARSATSDTLNLPASCPCRGSYIYSQIELDVLYFINEHRQNLPTPLPAMTLLNHISNNCLDHTNYMVTNGVANHNNFGARAENIVCALNVSQVYENVAYNISTAQSVVYAWLQSASHRANIEKPTNTYCGISVRENSLGKKYYTNMFSNTPSGSCAVAGNPCNSNPPTILYSSINSYSSANLGWNQVSNFGYQVMYRKVNTFGWTYLSTNSYANSLILNNLSPATNYEWRVRTGCATGLYGKFGASSYFATPVACPANLYLTYPVTNQTYSIQASVSISTSGPILNNVIADYRAGSFILLSDGFYAVSGSKFRAYIQECDEPDARTTVPDENIEVKQIVGNKLSPDHRKLEFKTAPNPNGGIFIIDLVDFTAGKIEITDVYGFPVYNYNFVNEKEVKIDIQNNPSGIYIIRVTSDDQRITSKIIKN